MVGACSVHWDMFVLYEMPEATPAPRDCKSPRHLTNVPRDHNCLVENCCLKNKIQGSWGLEDSKKRTMNMYSRVTEAVTIFPGISEIICNIPLFSSRTCRQAFHFIFLKFLFWLFLISWLRIINTLENFVLS